MMAYTEIKEETPDIMKIKIGNIPSNETVKITLTYL